MDEYKTGGPAFSALDKYLDDMRLAARNSIEEAKALGVEFRHDPYLGFWWLAGRRSALDQYGKTFPSEIAAAEDFLKSREAQTARRVRGGI